MNDKYNRYFDFDFFIKVQEQKSEIKKLGLYTGFSLICQIVLQNLMSVIIDFAGLTDKYLSDGIFQNAVDIIIVILSMLVPFYFISAKMKEISGTEDPVPLGKPVDNITFVLAVVAGIGFCMMANIVTSYMTAFFSVFGMELYSPEIAMPGGAVGIITSLIRVVALAAIAEEITLRGYVMGNLRKYGDTFAIIASSFVFAVMHGNLVQAPFALIAGFALGYLSIKTGTIWTGIIIHAANNFISTVVTYAMDYLPEETVNIIFVFILYGFISLGLVAMYFFKKRTAHLKLNADYLGTTTTQKMKSFIVNPAMIIALMYMFYITLRYIGLNF